MYSEIQLFGTYNNSFMGIFRSNLLISNSALLATALFLNLKTLNERELMADTEYLAKY